MCHDMLLINSPAIDAGNDCVVAGTCGVIFINDQRGDPFSRLQQAHVDIGAYELAVPTAAPVIIAGRVTNGKSGISGALISAQSQDGIVYSSRSNSFGYFTIEGFEAGQTVLLHATSKGYTFEPRVLNLADDIIDFEFVGRPR